MSLTGLLRVEIPRRPRLRSGSLPASTSDQSDSWRVAGGAEISVCFENWPEDYRLRGRHSSKPIALSFISERRSWAPTECVPKGPRCLWVLVGLRSFRLLPKPG